MYKRQVWIDYVGHTGAAGAQAKPAMYEWTRVVGEQLLGRLSTLVFTLVTLYLSLIHI